MPPSSTASLVILVHERSPFFEISGCLAGGETGSRSVRWAGPVNVKQNHYLPGGARSGLALGVSPRPSEGSLGGDDTATMRAPPWPLTAAKALRVVLVLGLQRWRRGWSCGFLTVDAKWLAGARAENHGLGRTFQLTRLSLKAY